MAIRGNLSEASLADVLQLLALGRKNGCLSLAGEACFGAVQFIEGRVVSAGIVNNRDRLGDRLLRSGVTTADELARIVADCGHDDDRVLAEVLMADKSVPLDVVQREYRNLMEEVVYQLFGWTEGSFTFEPDAIGPGSGVVVPSYSMSVDSLLLEGARRVDEWSLIEKKIPGFDIIFEADNEKLSESEVSLGPVEEKLLAHIDGTCDVNMLMDRTGLGQFETGKALYGLLSAGYIQRVGRSAARRQPPPESRVTEHRNLGVAFYRTGMLREAEREFMRVLELRPGDGAAIFYLGLVHARRGEWREAAGAFHAVSELPEAPAAVFHNLAFAIARCGDLTQAAHNLAEAELRAGSDPDPRLSLSAVQLALADEDLHEAELRLEEARTRWLPRQPSAAWFYLAGLCAALAGDRDRAVKILEEGIDLHPHSVPLHNNLAVVLERMGHHETAARALEHALLEDAASAHLHKNLGDYHYRAQHFDEALEAYTRVLRLAPRHGPDVYLKIGNVAYRRGEMNEARSAWEQALTLDPGNRIVHANLTALGAAGSSVLVAATESA